MSTTLEALNRAVIASPEDHTVRLVYADALDETGDPTDAARAEFIRSQIKLEAVPESDRLHDALDGRCRVLFEEHWLAWWRPVCKTSGLPSPHTPRKRFRDRIVQAVRGETHPAGWPYFPSGTEATTVSLAGSGLSIRFDSGFPEEVRFVNMDTPEGGPELVHRWGDAMPLVRLAFVHAVSPAQWERVNGPHLARLPDLTFDRLTHETASAVAASPYLAPLTRLAVNPVGANSDAITALVMSPAWSGLRTLRFTGLLSPDSLRTLAADCNLEYLEELDLTLGDVNNPLGEILSQLLRTFLRAVTIPTPPAPQWVEFGQPLEALAATRWVGRLRRLRIAAGESRGLFGLLGSRLYGSGEQTADTIPDAAVLALAEALNRDKLESLVLPAAVVGPSVREELTSRLGGKVAFA